MKFLPDENLSPVLRDLLVESGHDVIHVRDLQMAGSTDEEVIAQASAKSPRCVEIRIGLSNENRWGGVQYDVLYW